MFLSGFPSDAVEWADKQMSYANKKHIRDPFKWFFGLCRDYCKRESLVPDYAFVSKLKEQYGYTKGMPLIKALYTKKPSSHPVEGKKVIQPPLAMHKKWSGHTTSDLVKRRYEKQKAMHAQMDTNGERFLVGSFGSEFMHTLKSSLVSNGEENTFKGKG